jgi:ribokinase
MQLEIPVETVELASEIAAPAGVPIILDPAPAQPLPQSLLRNISWLSPNETETATLLNRPAELFSAQEAAERLLCLGVRNVVLKMGRRGVYLAGKDSPPVAVESFSVDTIDTTAAGDAFNAAFAVRLLQGQTPAEAAVYANAAAAISVTRAGAQPSMPTAQEVEAFLREKIPANQVEVVLRT